MPLPGAAAAAAPSYSSMRVQKAYRLNGVEGIRLQWRLQILDRQKVHAVRLVNQDIRLTRIALEHIHISSGVSVDEDEINVDTKSELAADGPMFLYGERQVSRKQGRARRTQSAVAESSRRKLANNDAGAAKRPQTAMPTTFAVVRARAETHFGVSPLAGDDVDSADERPPAAHGLGAAAVGAGFFHALAPRAARESIRPRQPPDERPSAAVEGGEDRRRPTSRAKTAAGRRPTQMGADARPATAAASSSSSSQPPPAPSAGKEVASDAADKKPAWDAEPERAVARDRAARPRGPRRSEAAVEPDQSSSTPLAPQPPPASPPAAVRPVSRAEQTAEAVKQARALSGRAKRFRNSVVGDPTLDQTLPMAEKKRKRKEALLKHRQNEQRAADLSVAEKVRNYLVQHPLSSAAGGGGGAVASSHDDDDDVFGEA